MPTLRLTPTARFAAVLVTGILALLLAVQLAVEHRGWDTTFSARDRLLTPDGPVEVQALDLVPEPGGITNDEDLLRFHARQQRLATLLSGDVLRVERDDGVQTLTRRPATITDLPAMFWVQIAVGLGALVIASWVWALRARDRAARLFALSGISTLMFSFSAAIYTTRELALPGDLFHWLIGFNVVGASLFGVTMIALFLVYPIAIRHWRTLALVQAGLFTCWTVSSLLGLLPAWAGVNLITLMEMIGILLALSTQFVVTRGDPTARASLSWLGLSVLAGAGGFIALNALPLVLGIEAAVEQGLAFLLFLVIYLGLAAGITRYRLFDVGGWAFSFLFYALGTFLLILLDAALIFLAGLDRLPALGVSFFAIGLLYLPMRDALQRFFRRGPRIKPHVLLDGAMQVALAPAGAEREASWRSLLREIFDPLEVVAAAEPDPARIAIRDDGLTLHLPGVAGVPPMRLRYPHSGRSLFSGEAEQLARQLVALVERAASSRDAYEKGVREERVRIAQDLHDDVGARLLNGIHADENRLRAIIHEALADIRAIVRGIAGETALLRDVLADLREECAARLEVAGVTLCWPTEGYEHSARRIDYRFQKTLASTIREIVSNTLRHADASRMHVDIRVGDEAARFVFLDDGKGFATNALEHRTGFGLTGIRNRIRSLGGEVTLGAGGPGARIEARLPLTPSRSPTLPVSG